MKLTESTLQLSATHEARRVRHQEVVYETHFQSIFKARAQLEMDRTSARQRMQRLLQALIDALLEAMDGKKGAENLAGAADDASLAPPYAAALSQPLSTFTWRRHSVDIREEHERTVTCAQGYVETRDGRHIAFSLRLEQTREQCIRVASDEAGKVVLRDPLVINFEGTGCRLDGARIDFDIDADGVPESLPGLGKSSGYLVFDRNGNGRVDDGRELFGTASGDGFDDLAVLDSDANGWIDASDPAWGQLGIWATGSLRTLAAAGVGAIATQSVFAPFSIKDAAHALLGQIQSAGVYLTEQGEAGFVQQVDLAVSAARGAPEPDQGQRLTA